MANWWDSAPVAEPAAQAAPTQASNWWDAAPVADPAVPAKGTEKPYKGMILPVSKDEFGNVSFDSNAGLLGAVKRAFTLPGEVAKGQVDPMSEQGIGRAVEMAGVVSPVNPAIRMGGNAPGAMSVRGMRPAQVQPPSSEALKAAAEAGYEGARGMGVDYSSVAVRDAMSQLRTKLEQDGILAELAPKTFGVLGKFASPPEGSVVPFGGLEAARRAFGNAAKDFGNPTEQLAAKRVVGGIDDFMARSDPGSVVAGPGKDLARVVTDARGNYAAAKRSDKIAGIEERAELNAAVANSGQNIDNALRQRARDILVRPKEAAGFSKEELAAIEEVARGTPTRNAARMVGNLLGGGGGLGSVVTGAAGGAAGGLLGGPMGAAAGAALPIMGLLAKRSGNAMTSKAMTRADELVRQRSPLFNEMAQNAPMEVISPAQRAMLVRGLLSIPMQDRY